MKKIRKRVSSPRLSDKQIKRTSKKLSLKHDKFPYVKITTKDVSKEIEKLEKLNIYDFIKKPTVVKFASLIKNKKE